MLGRAEVYRGNAPADADRLGIGGAIYFEPRLPRKNRLRAGAQLGSFGERAAWLGAEVAREGDAALIAFRAASADNDYSYLDNAGTSNKNDDKLRTRPNADSSERDAWAIGANLARQAGRATDDGVQRLRARARGDRLGRGAGAGCALRNCSAARGSDRGSAVQLAARL